MKWIVVFFIALHGPDGREIIVNSDGVTSIFKPGKGIHGDVNCIVNMTNGKFHSVKETCEEVRKQIEGRK